MVSSSRPSLRSSSGRFTRKESPEPPVDRVQLSPATTTRSNKIPLRARRLSLNHSTKENHVKSNGIDKSKPPARKATRNHPLSDGPSPAVDREPLKPPTKVTVARPHGGLLETINGVRKRLNITDDDLSSKAPTPKPDSINGVAGLHEKPSEARALRSKDGGSRIKSELAIYFGNYDEVINDVPRTPELVEVDESILIIDEPLKSSHPKSDIRSYLEANAVTSSIPRKRKSSEVLQSSPHQLQKNAKTIDLSKIPSSGSVPSSDPLHDSTYFKPHKRAERKEKRLRNIEKERAQHEKVQLEQILEGLQGPDWLRVLGVTGVTDGERKDWEPKRRHFINEVEALVDKFRQWREEEKRLKQEREEALAAEEEEREEGENEDHEAGEATEDDSSGVPDSSDVDAWAARQLKQEAFSASASRSKQLATKEPVVRSLPKHASPEKGSTNSAPQSQFRERAIGKGRTGRQVLAFGVPLPDFPEEDFELPKEYLTPEALRANARKRRRRNRERQEIHGEKVGQS